MPTFEFLPWITGLVIAVLALLALTPFAYRGSRWMRFVAYPFAIIMLLNGVGHVGGTLYYDPGRVQRTAAAAGHPSPQGYSRPDCSDPR